MNISQAKDYIKDSVAMYLKKDEFGDYRIPLKRQRPIFIVGAPGIGKSAIMEQIASELGIALVSYSMTHHTRQSALGLPFIKEKNYDGVSVDVSEYTMSEIISSIYETMEASGIREGILFLDEINCVSETLYPSMLQFLQFKVFGRHSVPEGWVIVTAGNPPQYNKSVREFDVVTLDRLKVLSVEENYGVWRSYALEKGIHSAIIGYIDGDKDAFYHIETTASGTMYVTARGWEDLSDIIYMYEDSKLRVSEELIGQYIHSDNIVREFAAYYDLFNKYKNAFKAEEVFANGADDELCTRLGQAPIDERIALVGILMDVIKNDTIKIMGISDLIKKLRPALSKMKEEGNISSSVNDQINKWRNLLDIRQKAGTLSSREKKEIKRVIDFYEKLCANDDTTWDNVSSAYNHKVMELKNYVNQEKLRLHNAFNLVERAFTGSGNEMLIFVTELTAASSCASFLATYGSEDYDKYNSLLMVTSKEENLRKEIEELFELE